MLSRDTYPMGVKGPNLLCEFVTSSSCGHWYQSFLNKLSEVLHLRSSSYAIYCVRGARAVLAILIKETAILGEYERNTEFRRRTRRYKLTTSRISAIRRIFVLLITFSSNDLSSRLLKIEQISTIASFPLKLVQNSFLYRLYQLQILNSGCGL